MVLLSESILFATGDVRRALAAAQGDTPEAKWERAILLTYQRKYPEALALLAQVPDRTQQDLFGFKYGSVIQHRAYLYRVMGDLVRARPLYEQVLKVNRAEINAKKGYTAAWAWSKIAAAELALGHTAAGLDAISKYETMVASRNDHAYGAWFVDRSARQYAEARRPDLAVPRLARALASPGIGRRDSPVLLWSDPAWDPIRHDQGFQALLKKYAKYKPVVTYDIPPAASSTK